MLCRLHELLEGTLGYDGMREDEEKVCRNAHWNAIFSNEIIAKNVAPSIIKTLTEGDGDLQQMMRGKSVLLKSNHVLL